MVKITIHPVPLDVGQDRHSAFPGLSRLSDGRLHLVWREGSDHYLSRDGDIVEAFSSDDGATYRNRRVLRTGRDYRDPSASVIDGIEHLTWFTGSATNPAEGAFTMRDWGLTVRFDGGLPYAATCAPVVKLPDGALGAAFYGRKPGESIDTAWMARSTDGGFTWPWTNRIVNSIGAGLAHNEPVLLVDGNLTHFLYRWGQADGIGIRTSTNSGLSGWGTPWRIANGTGRPAAVRANDGTLIIVYRLVGSGHANIAYSPDHGSTWYDAGILMPSLGGTGSTYAAMVPDGDHGVIGVLGMEDSGGARSKLYRFELSTAA